MMPREPWAASSGVRVHVPSAFWVPKVRLAPSGRPETGDAKLGAVVLCQSAHRLQLMKIEPCQNRVDTESDTPTREAPKGRQDRSVGARPPDSIICFGSGTVQAHLEVKQLQPGQRLDQMIIEDGTVRTDTGHKTLCMRIVQQIDEIRPQKRLPAPDIDLKDLAGGKLIDEPSALRGTQLIAGYQPCVGQTMNATEVAPPRDLPRHVDRRPQAFPRHGGAHYTVSLFIVVLTS